MARDHRNLSSQPEVKRHEIKGNLDRSPDCCRSVGTSFFFSTFQPYSHRSLGPADSAKARGTRPRIHRRVAHVLLDSFQLGAWWFLPSIQEVPSTEARLVEHAVTPIYQTPLDSIPNSGRVRWRQTARYQRASLCLSPVEITSRFMFLRHPERHAVE